MRIEERSKSRTSSRTTASSSSSSLSSSSRHHSSSSFRRNILLSSNKKVSKEIKIENDAYIQELLSIGATEKVDTSTRNATTNRKSRLVTRQIELQRSKSKKGLVNVKTRSKLKKV